MSEGTIIPTAVEYITMSGVRLHISVLNVPTVNAMNAKAADKFPYPDPTPYREPLENAVPGMLSAAEDNPAYVDACKAVDRSRQEWMNEAIFDYCVHYPDFSNREAILSFFNPQLKTLREIATLPEDDWQAVLHHIILSGQERVPGQVGSSDFTNAVLIALQRVALTGGDILNGIRMFRPQL